MRRTPLPLREHPRERAARVAELGRRLRARAPLAEEPLADRDAPGGDVVVGRRADELAGVGGEALAEAQQARSEDPRTQALLEFAVSVVEQRGQVDAESVTALREQGWSDEQIVETIAQVALNLFTNYINIALDVPVDFPEIPFRG